MTSGHSPAFNVEGPTLSLLHKVEYIYPPVPSGLAGR